MKLPTTPSRRSRKRSSVGCVVGIHRFFFPDVQPYATLLRSITEQWQREGHDVQVIAGAPERRLVPGGAADSVVPVRRVGVAAGRGAALINLLSFPARVGLELLRSPTAARVVMCSTAPQVTLGWVVSLAAKARGSAFIYHCMDLHPEIGRLTGEFSHPLVYRLLAKMDLQTMRRASAIVVLSDDMAAAISDRDAGLASKVHIISNFSLPKEQEASIGESPLEDPEEGTLRIVFTGNIGRFQALPQVIVTLAEAAARAGPLELVLMGDGKALEEVRQTADEFATDSDFRVRFLPRGSSAQARALMATAHLGLVSLMPEVIRYAYPSKTATYLGEGLPVLVLCEADSELAKAVGRHGLGIGAALGDAATVGTGLSSLRDSARLAEVRARCRAYHDEALSPQVVLPRWSDLLAATVVPTRVSPNGLQAEK